MSLQPIFVFSHAPTNIFTKTYLVIEKKVTLQH